MGSDLNLSLSPNGVSAALSWDSDGTRHFLFSWNFIKARKLKTVDGRCPCFIRQGLNISLWTLLGNDKTSL